MAKLYQVTWNNKILKLLYFKGKYDNKYVMFNKIKGREGDAIFTIIVPIIKWWEE